MLRSPVLPVLLLACAAMPGALAEVSEEQAREWYDVRQEAGMTLLRALNAASPIRQDGETFHGYTAWHIRWNYRWNQPDAASPCRITSVATRLSVKMTMPRWVAGPAAGKAEFDAYFRSLQLHEDGHRSIALEAAGEVDRSIAQLPPMASCQALEKEANRTGMAALDRARQREKAYDAATRHGCTQGACLAR